MKLKFTSSSRDSLAFLLVFTSLPKNSMDWCYYCR